MGDINRKYVTSLFISIFTISIILPAYSGEIIAGRELLKAMRGDTNSGEKQMRENITVIRSNGAHPTAIELLDAFRANKEQAKSFVAESKNKLEQIDTGNNYEAVKYNSTVFRTDGSRVCHRRFSWGDVNPKARDIKKGDARYSSFLWDGEMSIEYRPSVKSMEETRAFIQKDDKRKNAMVASRYKGAPFLGIFEGDHKPIDSVFLGPDTISLSVRKQMERVNGSRCYVIDADTKRGKYSVWLDPTHGYNIAKAEVVRRKGDLVYGHKRPMQHGEIRFSLYKVKFEQIDKTWLPMEARYNISWICDKQGKAVTRVHHTRTEININPDHDALGSFEPDDIKNGTHVFLLSAPKTQYLWRDGKVVDANGKVIHDPTKPEEKPRNSSPERLSNAKEVLNRFVKERKNFTSFIFEYNMKSKFDSTQHNRSGVRYFDVEQRYDGNRSRERFYVWGNVDIFHPNVSKDEAHYTSRIWDGKNWYSYTRTGSIDSDPGFVLMRRTKDPGGVPERLTHIIINASLSGDIMGYHNGDNGKRIDEVLVPFLLNKFQFC